MKNGISEILANAQAESDIKKRIAYLQANDSTVLRDIIKLAYDKVIKWALPEGTPPYKPNQMPDQQSNLYSSWRRLYLFFPGGGGEMPTLKREAFFIQFLEGLDPKDAELICAIKDKKMPYKIPKAQFDQAFPGVLDYSARDK